MGKTPASLFKLAVKKKQAGKSEEALNYLDQVLGIPGLDHRHTLMEKAFIYYKLGDYERCIECADLSRTINDIDSDTSNLPRGSYWIDGADSADIIDPEALLLKSMALDKLGKSKEARKCFKESTAAAKKLSLSGHACDWWAEQSSNYCDMGWWERAIFCEDARLKLDPSDFHALHEKACQLSNMGKHAGSLPLFDKAMEMGKDDEDYWFLLVNKGRALMRLGRPNEAIDLFDQVLSHTEKFEDSIGEVWYEKGRALMNLGQFEEAMKGFEEASENGYYSDGCYGKARALAALGKNEQAIICLDLSIASNTRLSAARLLKGKLLKTILTREP